jgi:hypothetical protein
MTFRVEVTPQAEQDADTILEWLLSQHAGETGEICKGIDSLPVSQKRTAYPFEKPSSPGH